MRSGQGKHSLLSSTQAQQAKRPVAKTPSIALQLARVLGSTDNELKIATEIVRVHPLDFKANPCAVRQEREAATRHTAGSSSYKDVLQSAYTHLKKNLKLRDGVKKHRVGPARLLSMSKAQMAGFS